MGKAILEIKKDDRVFFAITEYECGRRSTNVSYKWGGYCDQFRNGESVEEIIFSTVDYLRRQKRDVDWHDFPINKSIDWLLGNITQRKLL